MTEAAYERAVNSLDAFLADTQGKENLINWLTKAADVGEFLRKAPLPVLWFVINRMPAGRAGLLAAVGGSSKTRTLFYLAIGAIVGRLPWGWEIARTGRAVLLLAEDTAADVHFALSVVCHGLSPAERELVADRLVIYPMAGEDARMLTMTHAGTVSTNANAEAFLEFLRSMDDLVFVGLDPALALSEGDELSPAHQRRLGEFCDHLAIETGACVLLSAHAAKGSQSLDEPGSHTARGSGALTDCMRFELVLRTMNAQEARLFGIVDIAERKSYVQLVATKGNSLPPESFAPTWLKRVENGALAPADLVRNESGAVGRKELAALEVLRNLCLVSTPKLKEWREASASAGLLTGKTPRANESSMERIRDALLGAGLIERGISNGIFLPVEASE